VGFFFLQATRLECILIRPDTHLTPYEMYHAETSKWINFLRAFGEIATVKTQAKLQAKLSNRGISEIYLGPVTKVIPIHFGIPSLNTFLNHAQQYFGIKPMLIFIC
jgi:hypothetical protein